MGRMRRAIKGCAREVRGKGGERRGRGGGMSARQSPTMMMTKLSPLLHPLLKKKQSTINGGSQWVQEDLSGD
jgi:hypothetical protein